MKKKQTIAELKKDGKVTSASKIPVPEPKKEWQDVAAEEEIEEKFIGKRFLELCKRFKANPDDLFSWLMDNYGKKVEKAATGQKSTKTGNSERPPMSNWRQDYIKAKTGQK